MNSYNNTENSNPPAIGNKPLIKELHTCMGLNSCKGHDRTGTNQCAGQGVCATVNHSCHTLNNCRNQGGCGLYGDLHTQSRPGVNDCAWQGSCASPLNAERFITSGQVKSKEAADAYAGEPEHKAAGKTVSYNGQSVWQRARIVFEDEMKRIGRKFGDPPPEALDENGVAIGPRYSYIKNSGAFPDFASCGSSQMSGGGSCG